MTGTYKPENPYIDYVNIDDCPTKNSWDSFFMKHITAAVTTAVTNPNVFSDVKIIIVLSSGDTLELREQDYVTPREMIGISKFIFTAQCAIASAGGGYMWSDIITKLGIDRHFRSGLPQDKYNSKDTKFIFLVDAH